ncbi:hypothetical protein GTQ34_16590 [Muricauda sp. JGD-17]|uniref:Uncharacterized protein n=1 Tax=Flagellimonas ochracea TaxID=2696472 RepID=A0A964TES2_9FLAO|nr:hypothetical protein [Allomuricauda ochracea]NAY93527.1 hypothetical protein [Allomuricauda ochracea]
MTKADRRKYIVFSIVGLIIVSGLIYNSRQSEYLKKGKMTVGTITDFHFCNYNYCGTYKYKVGGKTYEGHWRGGFFKCPDGTEGCLGKEFPVRYSAEKPSVSEIHLGEFENRKNITPTL